MTEHIDPHCPPFADPPRTPSVSGNAEAVRLNSLASAGHMILEDVNGWLGSAEERDIIGRWRPDGSDLGELGGTMALAFTSAEASVEDHDDAADAYDDDLIADAFFWLDCLQAEFSMTDASAIFPWSVSTHYRHPLVGLEEVPTLRCNTGAPWRIGGEIHITPGQDGRPFCAELTAGFWLQTEVSEGLKWLSEYLGRNSIPVRDPIFETITDGDGIRFNQSWWSNEFAHYEVFCTLGEDASEDDGPEAAPHYITVRKFLRPGEPRPGESDAAGHPDQEPTMDDILWSIRAIMDEEAAKLRPAAARTEPN